MKHKQAFSLIELMVVISIIAVLAAMGVANFAAAIKKSRDSVRKSELAELTQALMMFRADWGSYPNPDTTTVVLLTTPTTELEYEDHSTTSPTKRKLVPDYIRSMPIDEARASEVGHQYTYHCMKVAPVTSSGTTYNRCVDFSVCAYLEVPQVSGANSTTNKPIDANPCNPSDPSDPSCNWFCMYSP